MISPEMIRSGLLAEEILYINGTLDDIHVQPYYYVNYYDNANKWFNCMGMRPPYELSPCNSNFTRSRDIFPAFRIVDNNKIAQVVKQTGLLSKVNEYVAVQMVAEAESQKLRRVAEERCQKLQMAAEEFKTKIIIEPQISDRSGFFKTGEPVVSVWTTIVQHTLDCPMDLKNVEYSVSIQKFPTSDWDLEIDPSTYNLKYNNDGYYLKPSVTILSKKFSNIYPKYTNEDKSLRIDFDGTEVWLVNKTNNYLQVKSISVYYNGKISDLKLGESALELPPQSTKKEPILIDTLASDEVKAQALYQITKDSVMNRNILFGFAIKYMVVEQNIDKTLFNQKKYNLYDVIMKTR